MLDEIIDFFVTIFEWTIEILGDLFELVTGIFDGLEEFNIVGIIFAGLVVAFIYAVKDYMLNPFLIHMSTPTALFWMVATYATSAILGYIVGAKLFGD